MAQTPQQKFREAILSNASINHLQRLSTKLTDIRCVDPSTRQTSLMLAATKGRVDVCAWLILDEGHEEVEISRDVLGETVLHVAASNGNIELLDLYLSQYPFVLEWVNIKGLTPLHLACKFNQLEVVQVLIESGSDMNSPDTLGNTPLILASTYGRLNVVKLLITLGADWECLNNEGFTAADYSYTFAGVKAIDEYVREHYESQKQERRNLRKQSKISQAPPTALNPNNSTLFHNSPIQGYSIDELSSHPLPYHNNNTNLSSPSNFDFPLPADFSPTSNNPIQLPHIDDHLKVGEQEPTSLTGLTIQDSPSTLSVEIMENNNFDHSERRSTSAGSSVHSNDQSNDSRFEISEATRTNQMKPPPTHSSLPLIITIPPPLTHEQLKNSNSTSPISPRSTSSFSLPQWKSSPIEPSLTSGRTTVTPSPSTPKPKLKEKEKEKEKKDNLKEVDPRDLLGRNIRNDSVDSVSVASVSGSTGGGRMARVLGLGLRRKSEKDK